ncbi:beta-galactosidase [Cohnella sp. LGH]|uniref:beta-galactosidase n=1 Tax=Cohnella sp. LGH TaxID=1619153 RepID=UPI001ADD4BC3|nr:beta-galactosidase [Cohnella sp. LGH]QTH43770.1 beta-galactosidase [Cohnella sp. LGH]
MSYRNRLEIGLWVSPPASEATSARYAEIKEAGFTFVIGLTEYQDGGEQAIERALDAAAANGLKYVVHDPDLKRLQIGTAASEEELRRRVSAFAGHPAYMGHLLKDEPSAPEIDQLASVKAAYLQAAPDGLAYVNLFPRHAAPDLLQADYADYIEKFMQVYKPQALSYDHYPFLTESSVFAGDRITEDYYINLEMIRSASIRYDTPFWLFVQTLAFNGTHRDPTEAEIRWQVNTSLAFGAKGIQYFTYWTPDDGREKFGDAIIARDGSRTKHYAEVQAVNRELAELGPALMSLKSAGVLFGGNHQAIAENSAAGFPPLESIEGDAVVVGCFMDEEGLPALFVVNGSYEDAAEASLLLSGRTYRQAVIVDGPTKSQSQVQGAVDLTGDSRLRLTLAPGEGKLVRFVC